VNTAFVAEFADQSVVVTIVNFVESPLCERGLKDMSFEDPVVVGGGIGDSTCSTPLPDPLPAEFTEGRDYSALFLQGETFKVSALRKFRDIVELTCGQVEVDLAKKPLRRPPMFADILEASRYSRHLLPRY
jgi:hypothetical protein